MLNNIYLSKKPRAERLISILIPVHKKGSVSDTNNYRGLALMSVNAKLHNRILLIRIRNGLDTSLRYHQNGCRSERATSQNVLAARRIFEEPYLSTLVKPSTQSNAHRYVQYFYITMSLTSSLRQ
jgi:hypothetical protein